MIFAMNFTFILNVNLLSVRITLENCENWSNRERKNGHRWVNVLQMAWESLADTFRRQPLDFMMQTKFHAYFIGSQYTLRLLGFVAKNLSPNFKHFHYFAWWHLNALKKKNSLRFIFVEFVLCCLISILLFIVIHLIVTEAHYSKLIWVKEWSIISQGALQRWKYVNWILKWIQRRMKKQRSIESIEKL